MYKENRTVSLGMDGPFELTAEAVDSVITRKSPGNYALGYTMESTEGRNVFIVLYVGRSDRDLNERVKDYLDRTNRYPQFKFRYASSPKAAFETECKNYHDFEGAGKLDNQNHPDRPDGTDWKCPVCDIFDAE